MAEPQLIGKQAQRDDSQVPGDDDAERHQYAFGKSVRVESDAQFIDTEP